MGKTLSENWVAVQLAVRGRWDASRKLGVAVWLIPVILVLTMLRQKDSLEEASLAYRVKQSPIQQ